MNKVKYNRSVNSKNVEKVGLEYIVSNAGKYLRST